MDPIPFHVPEIDESDVSAVTDVLRSRWLTTGERCRRFEEEFASYVGAPHAIATNSGTAAMHLALEAVGIGPGDLVLVPVMTFTATAEVVRYLGADPVFVDVDPRDANMACEQVLARLDVTQHVERDEHHSHNTQEKQHSTGFPWLQKKEIKCAVSYL